MIGVTVVEDFIAKYLIKSVIKIASKWGIARMRDLCRSSWGPLAKGYVPLCSQGWPNLSPKRKAWLKFKGSVCNLQLSFPKIFFILPVFRKNFRCADPTISSKSWIRYGILLSVSTVTATALCIKKYNSYSKILKFTYAIAAKIQVL